MVYISFKNWIVSEGKDIFGFEKPKEIKPTEEDENPIRQFNVERLSELLSNHNIGNKLSNNFHMNQIKWGIGPGSLRVVVHPDLHVEIQRLNKDLMGTDTWITKKLYLINREGYGGHEEQIVEELLDELKIVDEAPLESPKNQFEDLVNLVEKMAMKMRRLSRPYHYYEGIKKVNDQTYIIRFGVKGHGAEAPDQRRVIENQTMVHFDNLRGTLRLSNYNIETDIGGHSWDIMPQDTNVYFFPTQNIEEITEVIGTTMRWY